LTHSQLHKIYESLFEKQLESTLEALSAKSPSEWSKANVTVVGDASVFKQILSKNQPESDFYSTWFSGQYHSVVKGFKILTFGVVIDSIFYPLYYEFVGKKENKEKEIFCKLVDKVGAFWKTFQAKHPHLPKSLHLSCDNGYNCKEIVAKSAENEFILLCVPKLNHLFKNEDRSASLKQWIELEYLVREKEFIDKQNAAKIPIEEQKAFTWRVKAHYNALGIEVTLLFFRYNKSEKVTVIYCPTTKATSIFAKTMRHHWFARTQIEQFFRTVKHILKIQEAKSQTKFEMDIKIGRFFWLALDAQFFTNYVRKHCKVLKKAGLKQIIKHIVFNLTKFDEIELLIKSLFPKNNLIIN
jgi:hypothetical protein